jgi:hypothetical protein
MFPEHVSDVLHAAPLLENYILKRKYFSKIPNVSS